MDSRIYRRGSHLKTVTRTLKFLVSERSNIQVSSNLTSRLSDRDTISEKKCARTEMCYALLNMMDDISDYLRLSEWFNMADMV